MAYSMKGPVIRETEQLVVVAEQPLTFEGIWNGRRTPRMWTGSLEVERQQYDTYADILKLVDGYHEQIRKVLRVCMSTGIVEDITDDVLDAAEGNAPVTARVMAYTDAGRPQMRERA